LAASYPPFDLIVRTPRVELRGATDDLLAALLPVVRAGVYDPAAPLPFDDPMSFYDDSPQREWRWLRAIWAGRSRVEVDEWWRLYFVVVYDGVPIGMQDLTGVSFRTLRTVATFSFLGRQYQGIGLGREARAAVLHLAFDGLGAREPRAKPSMTITPRIVCLRCWAMCPTASAGALVGASPRRWFAGS
jgi:RimJ/RimL family protein N-acetyltransferase